MMKREALSTRYSGEGCSEEEREHPCLDIFSGRRLV